MYSKVVIMLPKLAIMQLGENKTYAEDGEVILSRILCSLLVIGLVWIDFWLLTVVEVTYFGREAQHLLEVWRHLNTDVTESVHLMAVICRLGFFSVLALRNLKV